VKQGASKESGLRKCGIMWKQKGPSTQKMAWPFASFAVVFITATVEF
jgi:hypothetical protein